MDTVGARVVAVERPAIVKEMLVVGLIHGLQPEP